MGCDDIRNHLLGYSKGCMAQIRVGGHMKWVLVGLEKGL